MSKARGAYAKALSKCLRSSPVYSVTVYCRVSFPDGIWGDSHPFDQRPNDCIGFDTVADGFCATILDGYRQAIKDGWDYDDDGNWTCPACTKALREVT